MEASSAAAVVYVFLDDADRTISIEDVKDWLQILDDVVEIKLQFDTATRRPCYHVQFRRAATAQQAVQYLHGARLKNCVVSIESRVFAAAPEAPGQASGDAAAAAASSSSASAAVIAAAPRKRCRETVELPANHLLPPDLQMDAQLAEYLPGLADTPRYAADGPAAWQRLQAAQAQLSAVYAELETTAAALTHTDARLAELLHGTPGPGTANDSGSALPLSQQPPRVWQARRVLCHGSAIPYDAHTPSGVVSLLTDSFGPVSLCGESATHSGFFLAVRFVFAADEERFMAAAAAPGDAPPQQRQSGEWRRIVQGLGWRPLDGPAARQHLRPPSAALDERIHRTVQQLLA
ncbi:RNA-binding protein 27 [Novymonas esmeraldas]|uniref:RNA-binding protein 27 n=1 Tax=Novymonas esmeraldas TaxID=1808958 RepID=A0AAW0F065_9TRYP